jgi:hypothetical protein
MRYQTHTTIRQSEQIRMFSFADLFVIFYVAPSLLVSLVGSLPGGSVWLDGYGRSFLLFYFACSLGLTISSTLYHLISTLKFLVAKPRRNLHALPLHSRSELVMLNLNR